MSYTIPSNTLQPGAPSHTPDHDNLADMLGLLTRAIAQGTGKGAADPGGNAANVAQIQAFINSGALFTGAPLLGPFTATPTVWRLPDSSILVMPLSTYGFTGDDAVLINKALAMLTAPGTTGPSTVRLMNGGIYDIQSTIGGSSWVYGTRLDGNGATLNWAGPANSDCVNLMGVNSGGYNQAYPAGGMDHINIIDAGSNAGCTGLRYGAGEGFGFQRVRVHQFSDANNGSHGIIEDNTQGWTEKTHIQAEVTQCDTGFYIFTPATGGAPSHEYNTWDLFIRAYQHQTLLRMNGNGGFTSGGELHLKGNCGQQAHPSGNTTATASVMDLSAGGNMNKCLIYVEVETTGSGSFTWQTITFGPSATGGTMNDCMGMLRFLDSGFTVSDAVASQFSFGGMITENNAPSTVGLKSVNTKPQGWL